MFTVTASHVSADYDSLIKHTAFAESTEYRVRGDAEHGYYASGPLLGCGRTCRTPEAAIHDLLAANGYTNIQINPAPKEATMSKPIAKSLHTVTVLVRVARLLIKQNLACSNVDALMDALDALGLSEMPDTYGLIEQALKQLSKGN